MKKTTEKQQWIEKFTFRAKLHHPRSAAKVARKLYQRCASARGSMVQRSKEAGVECTITADDLRKLIWMYYGETCRYCSRKMLFPKIAFDHVIPVSKKGASTPENIEMVCRPCNIMKGSLDQAHFMLFLDWLLEAPEPLRRDLSIRLARGLH